MCESLKVCLNAEILENDKQKKNDKIKAVVSLPHQLGLAQQIASFNVMENDDILRNLSAASSQTNPSGVCNAS